MPWRSRSFADEDGQRRLDRKLLTDKRAPLTLRNGTADADELALERQNIARLDDALEPAVVDAAEERDLAAIRVVGEHGDRSGLRNRLDHQHAGHHRPLRKVAGKPPVVGAD